MSEPDLKSLHLVVREVSLRSGAAVANALRHAGRRVTEVDVKSPDFVLPPDT